jgi:hypothetical protein
MIVQVGKHIFKITKNIQSYRGEIIIHTYKLGGIYEDCVHISYKYKDNLPVQVIIPHLLYEPECAVDSFFEKGSGTESMIKTAIRYAFNDVPSLPNFEFDDDSHIDCVEKDMGKIPPRKPQKPMNLAYFYIAYYGKTWYESRFNAKMVNASKYAKYRESLRFLTDPSKKLDFPSFLEIIGYALDSTDKISYIEKCYEKATTYREFFENIPRSKRCEILAGWLNSFMKYYIGSTFNDKGWYINIYTMDDVTQECGSLSRTKQYRIFSHTPMTCL